MAEKVFTSIINHFSSFTALILALTFAVVINGAPLSRHNNTNDDDTLSPSDNTLVAKLLLQWSMYETYPNHRSEALALELQEMDFYSMVCPTFVNYTRFNFTLGHLPENDTRVTEITLISFLLMKTAELACENVATECNSSQECSTMSCNISSIADLCLQAPTDILAEGFNSTSNEIVVIPTRRLVPSIQQWLRQNLNSEDIDSGVFDSLSSLLLDVARVECTIPQNSTIEELMCHFSSPSFPSV